MDSNYLLKTYLNEGTPGYGILLKFYRHHTDVLQAEFSEFGDFLHEVFINLSSVNMTSVLNEENYMHRAIKNQCWKIFNRHLGKKDVIVAESRMEQREEAPTLDEMHGTHHPSPAQILEGKEMLNLVMQFKSRLESTDLQIFNALIDGEDDFQLNIAKTININQNTMRTKVRRIRMAFDEYLKEEYC